MKFSDRAPSGKWAALKRDGAVIAGVWFKPDGDPHALSFRVPQARPETADLRGRLTLETLLKAVAVSAEEVESWRVGDEPDAGTDADRTELNRPLPDVPDLTVHVRLKPPAEAAVAPIERSDEDVPLEKWQDLEARWKAVLALEAGITSLRMSIEGLRAELEREFRRSLNLEEKNYALQSDVAQWTRAKSRVHFALPKMREFVHRATWATATPERKRLEDIVKNHIEPRVPFAGVNRFYEELEHLQKDRQVLTATGNAVYQEGRGLAAEIQRALGTLQRNATDRARARRSNAREKGKFF
ncbi:MAG: hypothetical protein K2X82_29105 [Gemmataceae bacterium]|nr:hypothetical protein [Gemmataceae bacterium]